MIIVILAISAIILGIGLYIYIKHGEEMYRHDREGIYQTLIGIGISFIVVSLIVILCLGITLSNKLVIDDKIAVYQEENANIEQQIAAIVNDYKVYEKDTYSEFENESPTILISLFPELKSDTLVAKQIEIYVENNKKIKELKTEKLEYRPYEWWLYFGGTKGE